MGYDSRLHFVQTFENNIVWPDKLRIVDYIAMVDLCKAGDGPVGKLIRDSIDAEKERLKSEDATRYFLWHGDDQDDEDAYEDPITPITLDALIHALHTEMGATEGPPYRRFVLTLTIAQTFLNDQWSDVIVLHEGH